MLIAKQDPRTLQRITMQILRTREQNQGTGIFYHTDLRRDVLVPIRPGIDPLGLASALAEAGLSSKIGGTFSRVPEGYRRAHLYNIIGTCVETDIIQVAHVEGDVLTPIDPKGHTVSMEILDEDLLMLQEQNQMTLLLSTIGFVQFNAQYYGEGFDEDGRDRNILQGSFWVTPQNWTIEVSRPEQKSAAHSPEEIREIAERHKIKGAQRAVSARAEKWAARAERDDRRALAPMPPRRGSNSVIQLYGANHYGRGDQGVPFNEAQ